MKSGYQTAILKAMKVQIYTIERQRELFKKTQRLFDQLGLRPKSMCWAMAIWVFPTKLLLMRFWWQPAHSFAPKPLLSQLKIGGRLVIPIGDDPQIMHRFKRTGEKTFDKKPRRISLCTCWRIKVSFENLFYLSSFTVDGRGL